MKVCGIIAEYNPFHNGHAHQIQYAREVLDAEYVVVAMSGDFVQRGTPAVFEKRLRTQAALAGGADLVLELPVRTASASAEGFASGAAALLDSLGVCDTLCFGSELGDAKPLLHLAQILVQEPAEYQTALRASLSLGNSFPAAREAALAHYLDTNPALLPNGYTAEQLCTLLSSPNNLLGIEYCKAILRKNSSMRPEALKRRGTSYHAEKLSPEKLPSASALRCLLMDASKAEEQLALYVPSDILPIYMEEIFSNRMLAEQDLDLLLRVKLLNATKKSLLSAMDVSDSLADRILNLRNECDGFASFTKLLKTKEITQTRIQRALLHILLQIPADADPTAVPYARVLGFRRTSGPLLRYIRKNASIPLLQKASEIRKLSPEATVLAQEDLYASNLWETLASHKTKQAFRHEYEKPAIIR